MKVIINRDKCIGAGNCVVSAPATFMQDDEGVVQLLDAVIGSDQEAAILQAVDLCPARAIEID